MRFFRLRTVLFWMAVFIQDNPPLYLSLCHKLCCIVLLHRRWNSRSKFGEAPKDTKGLWLLITKMTISSIVIGYKNIPIFLKSTCQVVIKQCTYSAVNMIEYIWWLMSGEYWRKEVNKWRLIFIVHVATLNAREMFSGPYLTAFSILCRTPLLLLPPKSLSLTSESRHHSPNTHIMVIIILSHIISLVFLL